MDERTDARLNELKELKDGWLDGEGLRVSGFVMAHARTILNAMEQPPAIFPTVEGGLSIEWAHGRIALTIDPYCDHSLYLYGTLLTNEEPDVK